MEDGLVLDAETRNVLELFVLILVVMEDGLVLVFNMITYIVYLWSLNPCCNGRWSRTSCSCNRSSRLYPS